MATVLAAAVEVRQPSILGELIIALTFVPIITLQGLEGKMFSPLAFTVALALLASLLLSIFVIPVLCLVVLKPETLGEPRPARDPAGVPALAPLDARPPGHGRRGGRCPRVRRARARAAPRHRVPAHHGRGGVRHGRPAAARRVAGKGARDDARGREAADEVPRTPDRRVAHRADRRRHRGQGRGQDRVRRGAETPKRVDERGLARGTGRQDA